MTSRRLSISLAAIALAGALLWLRPGCEEPQSTSSLRPEPTARRPVARFRALPGIELAPGTTTRDPSARAGLLTGTVRSSRSAAAIAGAQLHVAHGGQVATITSDEAGRFTLQPSAPGVHELLFVSADGYWPLDAGPTGHLARFTARPGERLDGAVIELDPISPVTVTVIDAEGEPVAGAQVEIEGEVAPESPAAAQTGDDGALEIAARRGAVVRASKEGAGTGRAVVDEMAEGAGALTVTLEGGDQASGAGHIAGTVVGPDGAPQPFALVAARSRAGADGLAQTTADEAGRFRLDALVPGTYDLLASAEGLAPAHAAGVHTGTGDVELVLATGGSVAGTVVDDRGAPVAAFTVVTWQMQGALERGAARAESFFDAAGRYELRDLQAGPRLVAIYAGGWAPSDERRVQVAAAPAPPARADFVLSAGGRVLGRVVEEGSGAAIAGATVSLEQGLGPVGAAGRIVASAVTGADGRFELGGVPPGRRSLVALAPGHDGRIVSGVQVGDDDAVGPITVELRATPEGRESRLQYTGIGAVLAAEGDALVIREAVAGGGAEAAGLAAGDRIVAIDGRPVIALGFEGSIHHIRGPVGSVVRLGVERDGERRAVEVVRRAMD